MTKKLFTVLWKNKGGKTLIPIHESNHCETAELAKAAGKKMLTMVRHDAIMPSAVAELGESEIMKYIVSDREIVEYPNFLRPDEPNEVVEFIVLNT